MASGLIIAAPSSGAGKTFVTMGLIGALCGTGRRVAAAKAGPDYLDPRFHEAASGRPAINLDPWGMRPALVRSLATGAAANADLLVVEGAMGLFDGPESGGGSTADLAALLALPVILVVDAAAQAQSAAALVQGFAAHRADSRIAGVILNRIASPRHERLVRSALDRSTIPVLGAVPRKPDLVMPSRHLGLVQAAEHPDLQGFVASASKFIAEHVDLKALAGLAEPLLCGHGAAAVPPPGQRLAVARDEAFTFAYPHLLDGWRDAGADIVPFSPLADEAPDPSADAVYLPGGYPELHAGRLAAASRFQIGLKLAAARGALVYGECGGFMVLGEELVDGGGIAHRMTGLLPVSTSFAERRLHLGYRLLRHDGALPWPRDLRGHEFHYSVELRRRAAEPLFSAADAAGANLGTMGLRSGRVMGSYAHVVDMEAA